MKVLLNQQVAQTNLLKNNLSDDNSDIKNAQTMSEVSLKEMPDKRDIVSFKALTKAKLKGFDLAMVEKLKAPLQNFRDVEHIQTWAGARFISLSFDKVKSRTKQIAIQKNAIFAGCIENY